MMVLTKIEGYVRKSGWRKLRIFAASALVAAIFLSRYITMASSDLSLIPKSMPIPASYFSLNLMFHPSLNTPWPATPFYGWRAWHALWYDLEPQKGQWQFDHLDKLVSQAQQHNSEMMLIMSYSPPWASSKPSQQADWKPGTAGPVQDVNDWRDYVRTVGTRYKGKIHVYEMWNEPDRPKAWAGDVDGMVQTVREASKILKGIDPSNIIVSPSATTPNGNAWLNDFLNKGGAQYVDVIGYHFYTGRVGAMPPPESMVPLIQNVKNIMTQHGIGDKPLWDTEAGWLGPTKLPDDQQAAYVARSYIVNWAAGADRFYWFQWDIHQGSSIEMVRSDNLTLTPAGKAFITIQAWMNGAVMHRCLTSENHDWVCEFDQHGAWKYIVWNPDSERDFKLAKNWRVSKVTQLDGSTSGINGDSIHIGIRPVLIQ
jgi:hypothetical protein